MLVAEVKCLVSSFNKALRIPVSLFSVAKREIGLEELLFP